MADPLAVLDDVSLSTDLRELAEQAADFAAAGKSENTKRAYRSDWKGFTAWCNRMGAQPMPATAGTVAAYVTDMARVGRAVSTINRYCTTIGKAHRMAGHPSPLDHPKVQEVLAGIRRKLGTKPNQKKAAVLHILRAMCEACDPDTIHGIRDRAVLLVTWAGAFRRSEVVSLRFDDVEFEEKGIILTVRKSKTDQEGAGARVGIPYGSDPTTCPVRSLKRWLDVSGITEGAIFRPIVRGQVTLRGRKPSRDGGKLISRIVKRAAKRAGLDPAIFGGHSLRAGLATQAAMAGKPDRVIMRQGRWVDRRTLERYIREGTVFRENAAAGIGL
jgi:integrase